MIKEPKSSLTSHNNLSSDPNPFSSPNPITLRKLRRYIVQSRFYIVLLLIAVGVLAALEVIELAELLSKADLDHKADRYTTSLLQTQAYVAQYRPHWSRLALYARSLIKRCINVPFLLSTFGVLLVTARYDIHAENNHFFDPRAEQRVRKVDLHFELP
jgi:hypothetical protein